MQTTDWSRPCWMLCNGICWMLYKGICQLYLSASLEDLVLPHGQPAAPMWEGHTAMQASYQQ